MEMMVGNTGLSERRPARKCGCDRGKGDRDSRVTKKRTDNERMLILASSSPQRKRLLEKGGYRFEVVVPTLGEPDNAFGGLPPAQQAEAKRDRDCNGNDQDRSYPELEMVVRLFVL